MAIQITERSMTATVDGTVIATATRVDGAWQATNWPHPLTRHQAITALSMAARLATGHNETDPLVITWRRELTGA
ncbi:hypothetical protein [Spirillospora sp. CA-294931]|uniref:hypothetical protein n=1 Tax=Spirillospora sp. CA-294931 TaxID=3240042 RepID=UPI003D8EC864